MVATNAEPSRITSLTAKSIYTRNFTVDFDKPLQRKLARGFRTDLFPLNPEELDQRFPDPRKGKASLTGHLVRFTYDRFSPEQLDQWCAENYRTPAHLRETMEFYLEHLILRHDEEGIPRRHEYDPWCLVAARPRLESEGKQYATLCFKHYDTGHFNQGMCLEVFHFSRGSGCFLIGPDPAPCYYLMLETGGW